MKSIPAALYAGIIWLAAMPLLSTTGCYTVNDRTVQVASEAYVEFVGSTRGATFSLDRDGESIVARQPVGEDRFAVPPGAYVLSVDRAATTIVRRRVLLTDGETLQINIP